jgi:hypothetical protein
VIDLGKKEPAVTNQTLDSIIASYVIAQSGDKERINQNLPMLGDYLKRRHIAEIPEDELLKKVLEQKTAFDSVERKARISAKLFTRDEQPRKAKYRSGSEFCGECKMFKNYTKECPYCGMLEITK